MIEPKYMKTCILVNEHETNFITLLLSPTVGQLLEANTTSGQRFGTKIWNAT